MSLPLPRPASSSPLVVGVAMGLGHLRAAAALADELAVPLTCADARELSSASERGLWTAARELYEWTSRGTGLTMLGAAARSVLDGLTTIAPLHPYRDQSTPTRQVRALDRLVRLGLGAGLAQRARDGGHPIVATYFAAAHAAEFHGCEDVSLVVTDADISRAWVPLRPERSRIRYFAPSVRARRRLLAYGVPADRIVLSGFPLPPSLVGGSACGMLEGLLAARLARLDPSGDVRRQRGEEIAALGAASAGGPEPGPPHLVFAVGGAGAQAELARAFLPSLAPLLRAGRLRLTLVAGLRQDIADRFTRWVDAAGLAGEPRVRILVETSFTRYHREFNATLASADVLWTKPSELTFYAALGLPLILSEPVGAHEAYNRRWARERGAALKQRDPRHAGEWLMEWLDEGLLAAAALAGRATMPARGAAIIARAVRPQDPAPA